MNLRKEQFTIISKNVIMDRKIPYSARFLLILLLSYHKGTNIDDGVLSAHMNVSLDIINENIEILIKNGYCIKTKINGKIQYNFSDNKLDLLKYI